MNYLQIENLKSMNESLLDLKITIDLAIKKLKETENLTPNEITFIEMLKAGFSLSDIQKHFNITQTRISLMFKTIIEKIYRITGEF